MTASALDLDVIVVGAGIAGASCGYHLAESRRVLVVERESQPGYHTTGRSAAFFAETYGNRTVRALCAASRGFFANPPDGFSEVPLWRRRRILHGGRADQAAAVDRLFGATRDLAADLSLVSGDAARRLFPPLRSGYAARAVVDGGAMELDVHAIHQGFLRGMRQRGGDLLCGAEVTGLRTDGDAWIVATAAGTFRAPVVVDAAGAWGDVVASAAGADLAGLTPLRRTIIVYDTEKPTDDAWSMFIDVEERFYVKPESGGLLASPCDETPSPPCDAQPEDIDVALAADRVGRATRDPVGRIRRKWAGLRTFAPDRSPVVGFDPKRPGFFWLVGQGGYGIMTAPALGRTAASLVRGAGLPADLLALGLSEKDLAPRPKGTGKPAR